MKATSTMKTSHTAALALLVLLSASAVGCDLFESDPEVEEVILVGTRVPAEFRTDGRFALTAVPLDESGEALLSSDVRASVRIEDPTDLLASVSGRQINRPSGDDLAVALNIDASGSTRSTDPTQARLAGAKTLVRVLDAAPIPFEAAVFEYPPAGALLAPFTSDVAVLEEAIDRIGSGGGTPTYRSLLEVLAYLAAEKPADAYDRSVVLLSDGQPGDAALRPEVCAEATRQGVPIYAIGLGPASDLDRNAPGAVAEMRAIAECTSAAYAGIDPDNVDSSAAIIFNNVGVAAAQGTMVFNVELVGEGLGRLQAGEVVRGHLALESGGGRASAPFSFRVP